PTETGLHALLFIFGDLVDACQNCSISFVERLVMAFQAKFFLDMWRAYLERAAYDPRRYFISHKSMDIAGIIVNRLISLVLVYCDFSSGPPGSLLPWLHSTEPTQHCFGEIRKLCPDFTLLNFHHMVWKLFLVMQSSVFRDNSAKERTTGYHHMYLQQHGIDLPQLSSFPSDDQIQEAIDHAYQESHHLMQRLGF
ncbi:hypothetical protein BS47DRAFT_1255292, partial [Hydnum rufescens UP504]